MAWRMFAGNVVGVLLTVAVGCSAPDNSNNPNPTTDGSLCLGKADCPSSLDASNGVDKDSNGKTDEVASNVDTTVVPTLEECQTTFGWITGKTGTCHNVVNGAGDFTCVFSVVLRDYGCAIRCEGEFWMTSPADRVEYSPPPPASVSLVTPDTGAGSRSCVIN